jgi:hypothetical protein
MAGTSLRGWEGKKYGVGVAQVLRKWLLLDSGLLSKKELQQGIQ